MDATVSTEATKQVDDNPPEVAAATEAERAVDSDSEYYPDDESDDEPEREFDDREVLLLREKETSTAAGVVFTVGSVTVIFMSWVLVAFSGYRAVVA